jgi:hypothetical protein
MHTRWSREAPLLGSRKGNPSPNSAPHPFDTEYGVALKHLDGTQL